MDGSLTLTSLHGTLKGTLNVTAGLGGMGGAQPLAITMNEGVALIAEVEEWRIDKRIETKYLDEKYTDIDEAIDKAISYKLAGDSRKYRRALQCCSFIAKIAGTKYHS